MTARMKFACVALAAVFAAGCDDDPTEISLDTPTTVTADVTAPNSVTVSWGAVSGASSYVVERATGGTYAQVGTSATTSYIDATVQPNTTYQYRVAAQSGSRQSSFSTAASVTTPDAGPAVATISADITTNRTLYADTTYTISGFIHVPAGVTLTIEPGTTILGDYNTVGSSLFILRGGRIMACGTAAAPIVFTSSQAEGSRMPGDWGGLIIVGNASINRGANTELEGTGGSAQNPVVVYGGGTDDADTSGELCYVRVEFAGYAISADNELNSFTFAAVGSGTRLEYLQALAGLDDHFEWFGGTVDSKYLVSYESGDDHFDASEGYRGRSQFMIAYQSKILTPRAGAGGVSSDPQGIENDGCAGANCLDGQNSQPYTQPLWANFTLVGTGPGYVDANSGGHGMVIRRGTAGYYLNGVVARWPKSALSVRDASTMQRFNDGQMLIANILAAEVGELLHTGQQAYDVAGNNVVSVANSAASLFTLLPTDPTSGNQFDWSPAPNAPQRTGGMTTFPANIATKAGTFITPTAYRGAADPAGPKWWEGWTSYADN